MEKESGISTAAAVIILIAVTVLIAGIVTAAIVSANTQNPAQQLPCSLKITGDAGILTFDDTGIEQIIVSTPSGKYVCEGKSPVQIPAQYLISPASVVAEYTDGSRTLVMRI